MRRALAANAAAVLGVALVTGGLMTLAYAGAWSQRADDPTTAAWSLRLLAVAGVALGQVAFAGVVVPAFFRRGTGDRLYAIGCGVAAAVAAVIAGGFGLGAW